MKKTVAWCSRFVLLVIMAIGCASCGSREPPRNVLLVTLDTVRADRLGCYGYGPAETPVLDGLAEEGVLFEHAYSQVPLTLPSHASILTGLYPPNHGIRINGPYRLRDDEQTLAAVLADSGYDTAAFIAAYVLDSQFGLARGFNKYDDHVTRDARSTRIERRADEIASLAAEWLKQEAEPPFFAWVHFFDPHLPYDPPEPYASDYTRDPYDGEIAFTDRMLGNVLNALEEAGYADDTLVVVVGDHGESLGEHDEDTHALLAYDTTLHVPLIVRGPGVEQHPGWTGGTRIGEVVETIDIPPSVLAWAGLDVELEADGRELPAEAGIPGRLAYAESWYPLSFGWSPLQVVRRGAWKLIQAPEPELYDTAADPSETNNLWTASHPEAAELQELLTAFNGGFREQSLQEAVDPATARALSSLGYVAAGQSVDTDQPFADLPNPMKRTDVFRTINEARHIGDTGDDARAIRMLDSLLEEEPRNPVLLQNLGRSLVRAGRYGRAVEILKRYVEVAPGDAESTLQLGHAYVARGEPARAIEYIEKSLELMPVYGEAWDELCVARAQLGQLDLAAKAGRRAVELEPANQQYRANLGVALMQQGKPAEALEQFEAGLDYNEASALLHYHRGLALRALERIGEAANAFRAAVQQRPDHVHARIHLVELAFRTGDEQTALRHGRELVDEGQATPVVQFCYGSLLVDRDEKEGLEWLKKTVKALPEFPPPAIKLAEAVLAEESASDARWMLDEVGGRDHFLPPPLRAELEKLAAKDISRTSEDTR